LVNIFFLQRSGLLSSDLEVRKLANNVLVALAWSGHLDKFIPHVTQVFNYQAIERLDKLESLLEQEFDKISHYELMYFSEITKGLTGTFDERDMTCRESVLELQKQT